MELFDAVVLVVDDDPDIGWVLQRLVESLRARCIRVLDAQSALQIVKNQDLSLVLLDAKLADMDGLELARQIRSAVDGVPIMLISGYFYKNDPAIQAALDQELICEFVEKPFSHGQILCAMKTVLCSLETAVRRPGFIGTRS